LKNRNKIVFYFIFLSFLIYPSNKIFIFFLGTVLPYENYFYIRNLRLKAIMFFTLFIVTYVSIITSDIENKFYNLSFVIYRKFHYYIK